MDFSSSLPVVVSIHAHIFDMLLLAGTSSTHGVPVEVKVDEMVDKESDNVPRSEEEE